MSATTKAASAPIQTGKVLPWIAWAHVVMVALGVGWIYWSASGEKIEREATLPVFKKIKGFNLTRSDGQPFSMLEMKGKVWIAGFVSVTGKGGSPVVTESMARLSAALLSNGDVRLVTVSVDPETDTLEKLDAFRENLGAPDSWYFLSGERKETFDLVKNNFMFAALEGSLSANRDPSTEKLVLVDQAGFLRGLYSSRNPAEMDQLVRDVNFLLR